MITEIELGDLSDKWNAKPLALETLFIGDDFVTAVLKAARQHCSATIQLAH